VWFPLIPLPIIEAIPFEFDMDQPVEVNVSINSTSNNRSDLKDKKIQTPNVKNGFH